jgi:DNA polymerase III sliding clamp (beta) subunit (PCNA family)
VVIPTEEKIKVTATFSTIRQLRDDLKRVALCADERSGMVKWCFGPESRIEAKSIEHGSASALLNCTVVGELAVGVNCGYVLDVLNTVEDGPLTIGLQDAQSSLLFTLDGTQYIIMPMRA